MRNSIKRLRVLCLYPIRYIKSIFKAHPSVGDKVKVRVGFGGCLRGIVSRVVINDHDAYCWIDEYDTHGKLVRSGTASFSYCVFEYL